MSKLMTDSKVLMDLFFDGTDPNDTPLQEMIDSLKDSTLKIAEMRACLCYMTEEESSKSLDSINITLVETLKNMLALKNEFKDLIVAHFKKGGER